MKRFVHIRPIFIDYTVSGWQTIPQTRVWIGVGSTSVLLEGVLLAFPVFLVRNLQMQLASKIMVVAGFMLRIP